jgi:PAS domain S-box-containing protein
MQWSAFNAVPGAIVAVNREGRIVHTNKYAEELFGYDAAELLNQKIEVLVPEGRRPGHEAHVQRYMAKPEMRAIDAKRDLVARRKDGTEFPVEIMLNPVDTADGPVVISLIHDVTEQRRREQLMKEGPSPDR